MSRRARGQFDCSSDPHNLASATTGSPPQGTGLTGITITPDGRTVSQVSASAKLRRERLGVWRPSRRVASPTARWHARCTGAEIVMGCMNYGRRLGDPGSR